VEVLLGGGSVDVDGAGRVEEACAVEEACEEVAGGICGFAL